jgi:hypothetical protein
VGVLFYLISDRMSTVYQNITQHNNQQNTFIIVSPTKCIVHLTLSRKQRPLSYQNIGQMNNIFELVTLSWQWFLFIIILWVVLIECGRSFLFKVRWTIYFTWWHCHGCIQRPLSYQNITQYPNQQKQSHDSVTN